MALAAKLDEGVQPLERRGFERRRLQLRVLSYHSQGATNALIHDLSETGMRLETSVDLVKNDPITVHLPEAGPALARVIWARGCVFGCEFDQPVSRWVVSAALLKSDPQAGKAKSFFSDFALNGKPVLVGKDGCSLWPQLLSFAALVALLVTAGLTNFRM